MFNSYLYREEYCSALDCNSEPCNSFFVDLPARVFHIKELPSRYDFFRQCRDEGIAIIGGDTIKGFTSSDQAWIALIGEKPDATLAKHAVNK
ncbi:hypothetical protein NC652_024852 [Populus alba x Populus x berolinensis]|nr:hypothetical protein NC652_024852 [Populus alba x Populus x berolinensis]